MVYTIEHDTITFSSSSITTDGTQTIVSVGETFKLGFFSLGGSNDMYFGIWYYKLEPITPVWVANREKSVPYNTTGLFKITTGGNLEVQDVDENIYWSTNLQLSSPGSKMAKILDSGNLVFGDNNPGETLLVLWESFNLKNSFTFLPGMKMLGDSELTSWKSPYDPGLGSFIFLVDPDRKDRFIIQNRSSGVYWRSGELNSKFMSLDQVPTLVSNLLSNVTTTLSFGNSTFQTVSDLTLPSLEMGYDGKIRNYRYDLKMMYWSLRWSAPIDRCSVLNACGDFGSCNLNYSLMCKCLPGFVPSKLDDWNSRDFSSGCQRKSQTYDKKDKFYHLYMMKVGKPDTAPVKNLLGEDDCREECLSNDKCKAYAYDESVNITKRFRVEKKDSFCWIWNGNLNNLQEEYARGGRSLNVRVPTSDLEATSRNCEPCGTNLIPYPLSTDSNCGDPWYSSFSCSILTGQVNFQTLDGRYYKVTNINPNERIFSIQVKNAYGCRPNISSSEISQLNISLPFHLNNSCIPELENPTTELEISWDPPLEPTCASSANCTDWPDSTCIATKKDGQKKCICNANFRWDKFSMNCTQDLEGGDSTNQSEKKLSRTMKIAVTSIVVFLIALSCIIGYTCYAWRKRVSKSQANRNNIQGDHALHMYGSESHIKRIIDSGHSEDDIKGIDVPYFDLESIMIATDNFSDSNKLGQGGFGPVYKGKFLGDQEIAVKKLSSLSGQGLTEFKNEVVLIAKLQHRNLVRLLGYCISGEEKILLYEYMPNRSLDTFIFDRNLCTLLDWEVRFNIILGVARGLLYLHQDSRLRIIHRDLKTSNILLDEEMNPKISDFGLARIFAGKQTEAATERIIGTYGYMSPEYALDGFFSVKSDVFSFGVVVLEIISGKRNTGIYQSEKTLSLLGLAWKFWTDDNAMELMDQTLNETCNASELLKCLNIGLLCVQEDANDRPTMSNVLFMLGSENSTLPRPKQPAFVERRGISETGSSSSKLETWSDITGR